MKVLAFLIAALVSGSPAIAADNKPVSVATGQEFKISLDSDPSTGQQWIVAKPLEENRLKLLGTEYKRGRPGTPGGGGHEILSFKALSEGKTEIFLKYGRLWERDVAPARTTNFVVVITKAAPH